MPTDAVKTLITWNEMGLLEQVTLAAQVEGVNRSEWVREACRRRLRAEDEAADVPDEPVVIGHRVSSARVRVPFEETP